MQDLDSVTLLTFSNKDVYDYVVYCNTRRTKKTIRFETREGSIISLLIPFSCKIHLYVQCPIEVQIEEQVQFQDVDTAFIVANCERNYYFKTKTKLFLSFKLTISQTKVVLLV